MRRKNPRYIDDIGKKEYAFLLEDELAIYKCVCGEKVNLIQWRKVKRKGVLFNTYREWRIYIYERYREYDVSKLSEFLRYLKYRMRINAAGSNYDKIIASVFLTFGFAKFTEFLVIMYRDVNFEEMGVTEDVGLLLIVMVGLCALFLLEKLIILVMSKFSNYEIESLFYEDYQEVIEEIIKEKLEKNDKKAEC